MSKESPRRGKGLSRAGGSHRARRHRKATRRDSVGGEVPVARKGIEATGIIIAPRTHTRLRFDSFRRP